MRALPFAIIYMLPLTVLAGYAIGGWATFMTLFAAFVLVPLADRILGRETANPSKEQEQAWKEALDFKLMTWISVPIQVSLVFWGAFVISVKPLSWLEIAGLTLSIGVVGGAMGITIAHEMCHRGNRIERIMSKTLLATVSYVHWFTEHLAGHHRTVATPEDPATARFGESFYRFWPRTVIGGFQSAWKIEAGRLDRIKLPVLHWENRILRGLAAQGALMLLLYFLWGFSAVLFFLVQGVVAFTLLEIVNYVEHYGLLRKKDELGEYEKVEPIHSWNASDMLTNYFLFNLQRHSDHHAQPQRRYQVLRHFDQAPQLPAGYAAMVPLALIPPLWFWLIDPLVPNRRCQNP